MSFPTPNPTVTTPFHVDAANMVNYISSAFLVGVGGRAIYRHREHRYLMAVVVMISEVCLIFGNSLWDRYGVHYVGFFKYITFTTGLFLLWAANFEGQRSLRARRPESTGKTLGRSV